MIGRRVLNSHAAMVLLLLLGMAGLAQGADTSHTLTVALLQMKPDGDNVAANVAKAEDFCHRAAKKGADIALMPEMWTIGYTPFDPERPNAREEFYSRALHTEDAQIARFAALAQELDMAIAVTYLQAWSPTPRNAVTLFDRHGVEVFTYAKVHTCDFKPMEASMTPGDAFFTGDLDTKAGPVRVGAMICFDREQPESARILMLKGAEIILTPNACGLEELRLDQFKVRAFENLVGVAMTNYPAPTENGRSVAFDWRGKRLVLAGAKEGLHLARFDLDDLRAVRAKSIWGNAYRRPHRYGPITDPARDETWRRINGNGVPFDAATR